MWELGRLKWPERGWNVCRDRGLPLPLNKQNSTVYSTTVPTPNNSHKKTTATVVNKVWELGRLQRRWSECRDGVWVLTVEPSN